MTVNPNSIGEILVTAQRPNSFFPVLDLAWGWSWIWTQAYRVINNNFPQQMLSTNNQAIISIKEIIEDHPVW